MTTYAISHKGETRVVLWATGIKCADGSLQLEVINGAWRGVLKNDELTVHGSEVGFPAEIVWKGDVPFPFSSDYNKAIPWIQTRISERAK